MAQLTFPLQRLNQFLDKYSFVVENPFELKGSENVKLTVKVELTNVKPLISVGDWMDYIEYTLTLEDINNEHTRGFFGYMFAGVKTNDYKIETNDTKFYMVTQKVNRLLYDFLVHFSVDNPVRCSRIINKVAKVDPKYMIEGRRPKINSNLIDEKYDQVVDKIINDIMSTFKDKRGGKFVLPEDISEELVYDFEELNGVFTVELTINVNPEMSGVETDGEFDGEDTIELQITTGTDLSQDDIQELEYELNEILVHELTHIVQKDMKYRFRKKEPEKSYKYYTQKHELEAQIAGFKRRARIENKPFEELLRNWLKKYVHRHGMDLKETEKLIKLILTLI